VHSLQTFEIARNNCDSPTLVAAALLHDIGKVEAIDGHAAIGAALLQGLLPCQVVWLVAHHMDLVYKAKQTERVYRDSRLFDDVCARLSLRLLAFVAVYEHKKLIQKL